MSRYQPINLPPPGFQAIPRIYFKHFSELPIPEIISEVLLTFGVSLSQLPVGFFVILRGFVNICLGLNIAAMASLFLYFYKLTREKSGSGRFGFTRRHFDKNIVDELPTNFGSNWKREFVFITSEFLPGSREMWNNPNRVHMNASIELSTRDIEALDRIARTLTADEARNLLPVGSRGREEGRRLWSPRSTLYVNVPAEEEGNRRLTWESAIRAP